MARGERVRDLTRRADASSILCYYRAAVRVPGGERWGRRGGDEITDWARERHDPVQHWQPSPGYRRVLLRRRPDAAQRSPM